MAYRDELGAAEARIRALEGELDDARAEIARLRAPAPIEVAPPGAREPAPLARPSSPRIGRVHYHPPPTYWPALRAVPRLFVAAWTSAPALAPFESESLLAFLLHYGVKTPIVLVAWPLYWASMVVMLPIGAALFFAVGIVTLPLLVLSRLTFSPVAPADDSAVLRGELPDAAARAILWTIAAMLVLPMAVTWRLLREKD